MYAPMWIQRIPHVEQQGNYEVFHIKIRPVMLSVTKSSSLKEIKMQKMDPLN